MKIFYGPVGIAGRIFYTALILLPVVAAADAYRKVLSGGGLGSFTVGLMVQPFYLLALLVFCLGLLIDKLRRKPPTPWLANLAGVCSFTLVWTFLNFFVSQAYREPLLMAGARRVVARHGGEAFLRDLRRDADLLLAGKETSPEVVPPAIRSLGGTVRVHRDLSLVVVDTGLPRKYEGWIICGSDTPTDAPLPKIPHGDLDLSQRVAGSVGKGVYRF